MGTDSLNFDRSPQSGFLRSSVNVWIISISNVPDKIRFNRKRLEYHA